MKLVSCFCDLQLIDLAVPHQAQRQILFRAQQPCVAQAGREKHEWTDLHFRACHYDFDITRLFCADDAGALCQEDLAPLFGRRLPLALDDVVPVVVSGPPRDAIK